MKGKQPNNPQRTTSCHVWPNLTKMSRKISEVGPNFCYASYCLNYVLLFALLTLHADLQQPRHFIPFRICCDSSIFHIGISLWHRFSPDFTRKSCLSRLSNRTDVCREPIRLQRGDFKNHRASHVVDSERTRHRAVYTFL